MTGLGLFRGTSITNGAYNRQSAPTPMGGFRGHLLNGLNAGPVVLPFASLGRVIGPWSFGGHEGRNGATTIDALNEHDAVMDLFPRPTVVTLEYCINDIAKAPSPDPGDAFKLGIADRVGDLALATLRRAPEAWVLALTAIPNWDAAAQSWINQYNTRLFGTVDRVRAVSGSTRVLVCQVTRSFDHLIHLSDGTHPNDLGYQMMSAPLYEQIRDIMTGQLVGLPATFPPSPTGLPDRICVTVEQTINGALYRGEATLARIGA